jgi:hypothetical protein
MGVCWTHYTHVKWRSVELYLCPNVVAKGHCKSTGTKTLTTDFTFPQNVELRLAMANIMTHPSNPPEGGMIHSMAQVDKCRCVV